MSKDTFDMFGHKDRGRFGDNESAPVRGNDSDGSDVDLTLLLRDERPLAIAVTNPAKPIGQKWIWLPKSRIEFEYGGSGTVTVTLSERLAKEKGLV